MKQICIINNHSPLNSAHGREALDMAMIFAAFEQEVSYILQGPAVLSVVKGQQPEQLGHKDYLSTIKALELYEVDNLIVCGHSLAAYGLTEADIISNAHVYNKAQINTLLTQQQHVLTF